MIPGDLRKIFGQCWKGRKRENRKLNKVRDINNIGYLTTLKVSRYHDISWPSTALGFADTFRMGKCSSIYSVPSNVMILFQAYIIQGERGIVDLILGTQLEQNTLEIRKLA